MLVNYRPYYRLIFTAITTLAGGKISTQKIKDDRLFLLDKSHKFQNYYQVNIVKQQNTVLIHHIGIDIKRHQP